MRVQILGEAPICGVPDADAESVKSESDPILTNRSNKRTLDCMSRQREFDRDIVLARAMHHFWEHGYEATSLNDLLGAMQIGRQSLYNTFGDKHSLFLASLEHYRELGARTLLEPLGAPDGGLAAIEKYFAESARSMAAKPSRACFVVNCSIEVAPHDPEVAAITNHFISDLRKAFTTALKVAVDKGEVQAQDIDAVAWRLTSTALGLAALSKVETPPEALNVVATQVLETLRV